MQVNNKQLVSDVMIGLEFFPSIGKNSLLKEALDQMLKSKKGIVCLTNDDNIVEGVFTDGDLRRLILKTHKPLSAFFMDDCIEHATLKPKTISPDLPLEDAIKVMTEKKVWDLPVVSDRGNLLGMLHLHDALAKVFK